jgi:hypothetical protein
MVIGQVSLQECQLLFSVATISLVYYSSRKVYSAKHGILNERQKRLAGTWQHREDWVRKLENKKPKHYM